MNRAASLSQVAYRRELVGRGAVLLLVTYVLLVGGTFNGVTRVDIGRFSLLLIAALSLEWIAGLWRRRDEIALPPLLPLAALWGAVLLLSAVWNWSARAQIGLWYAALYALAWFMLMDWRRRGLPSGWLINGALLAALPLMLLAVIQVLPWLVDWATLDGVDVPFSPPRPPSALGNPNALGAVLAVLLPAGIIRAGWAQRPFDRVLWRLWLLGLIGVLFLTLSRGAWLAALAGSLALMVLLRGESLRDWLRKHRALAAAGGLIGLCGMSAAAALAVPALDNTYRGDAQRLEFYRVAFDTFRTRPMLGNGPFTFGEVWLAAVSSPPVQPHAHAHNAVLNLGAELGLLGLLALAVSVWWVVRHLLRRLHRVASQEERREVAAVTAGLAAIGVHCLFDLPVMLPAVMLLVLAWLAAGWDLQTARFWPVKWVNPKIMPLVGLLLAAVVIGSGAWSSYNYGEYVRGQRLIVKGQYADAAAVLGEVAQRQPDTPLYHAAYGFACGLAAQETPNPWLNRGIAAYERALELEPVHAAWWLNLAALRQQQGDLAGAMTAAQTGVAHASDDPDAWIFLGMLHEAAGDSVAAREAYQSALRRDADWADALEFWQSSDVRHAVWAAFDPPLDVYRRADDLWASGQQEATRDLLLSQGGRNPRPFAALAALYVNAGETETAENYLAAARLFSITQQDWARVWVIEADIAGQSGDDDLRQQKLDSARDALLGDNTGQPWLYGRDVAYFHFLRVQVRGVFLPQVPRLGPDPALGEHLRRLDQ